LTGRPKNSARVKALIRKIKAGQGWHYQTPGWYRDNYATLRAIAEVYAQSGAKPAAWGSGEYSLTLAQAQALRRLPRGPVARNYGHPPGMHPGAKWTKLVRAVKKARGWVGSEPLYVDIDPGGRISVGEGNHRIQALTEAFGRSSAIRIPVRIGEFHISKRSNVGEYFVIPATVRPGDFTMGARPRGAHSTRLAQRKRNKAEALKRKQKKEADKLAASIYRDIFGDHW